MVKIKILNLAKKLDKNISQLAEETGLNRNSITALYHNKVNGIKFETINQLCSTYGIAVSDILEFVPEKKESIDLEFPYKQEGEVVPLTMWPPCTTLNKLDKKFFPVEFGDGEVYFKNGYGEMYWRKEQMTRMAKLAYERYNNKENFRKLYSTYLSSCENLKNLYYSYDLDRVISLNKKDFESLTKELWNSFERFWSLSLFIDGFDPGYDQQKIKEISERYDLTHDEVSILTTPIELTYNNERQLRLFSIIEKASSKISNEKALDKYLVESQEISKYIKDFDFYKSNYSVANHIDRKEIKEEITRFLKDKRAFRDEYEALRNYSEKQSTKVNKILKKHKLNTNPLEFFAQITYWREHRKMINLMGIHVIDLIMGRIEQKTGIPKKYLKYLSFDEVGLASSGLISLASLQKRHDEGMILIVRGADYKVLEGKEAESIHKELEERLSKGVSQDTVTGQVASQGYAKGIARIILDLRDFDRFKEGEILVTGMTRPEFVPLMKKAAGIVTNEGGITCHAAIVSRELSKPCIIGTQNATKLIHDGDMVEVRANHGTVRILKKAE